MASLWVLWGPSYTPQARVGLALSYAFLLPYSLLYTAFCYSILRISGTSLERLIEFRSLPGEPAWELGSEPPEGWPSKGEVVFEEVVLVYRPGLPRALDRVSLTFPGGSRTGVVGRTGAGKSSLMVPLFRLVDAESGGVLIDGVSVQSLRLMRLRRAMAVIAQEPLLLSGSVRDNLDPFGERGDEELASALKSVGVSLALEDRVGQGNGLSSGQRQLVSLARTLLQRAAIVVMDEPTSQVDPATDVAVQRAVRECLAGKTVVTIAHRLHTVINSDIIVVMEAGRVAESGTPAELCSKAEGRFAGMVKELGMSGEDLRIRSCQMEL